MSLTLYIQILSLGLVLNADSCSGAVPSCKFKWFETKCRYRCNCANDNCDANGECTGSSGCKNGWFGPACQYVNLVTTYRTSPTPSWVSDFPQCNPGQDTVTVSLDDVFYFTWLRLRANSSVTTEDFKLQLMYSNGSTVECSNMYTLKINKTILDVHCQAGVFFQQLNITGAGVKSLCSVFISGGRNVALGQYTNQSSTDYGGVSTRAVDGDTNPDWYRDSCTHTKRSPSPYWKLIFALSHQVHRYVIYNRKDEQDRLWGFSLEANQTNDSIAFNYTDRTSTNHDIYRIQSDTPQIPVSSVTVFAGNNDDLLLTICEMEMFGDTVCGAGLYGRECKNKCNCPRDEQCFVSTGGCPSGCAAGFQGEGCQKECDQKYYGIKCLQSCSKNCKGQLCQATNGTCWSCEAGKQGLLCNEDCNHTFWGDNCTVPCSSNCKDKLCNPVNGMCFHCPAGKSGENCTKDCEATYYGENCALTCSSNCVDQLCHATNGSCHSCVPGTSGLFCIKEDESSLIASIVGPVVAFLVLAALVVAGVVFWRRRSHKKNVPGQATSNGFHNAEIDSIGESSTATKKPNKLKSPERKKSNDKQEKKDNKRNEVGSVYYNQLSGRSETAIRFDELDNFMATHGKEFFKEQFNRIPGNDSATTKAALSQDNLNKNRYKNINAYDHSRVHLQTDVLKNHDNYINASYVDGYQQKKQFIASQGATKVNLEDIVRMLWEQEAEVVVMLTNLIEDGKLKCEQYWPDDGEKTIGEITVKLTTTQVFADYTIRRLCLYKKDPPVQVLTHFHFTTWPDKDVPTTAWGLVDLEQRMASIATSKPIVVHCSAGVGRTGTFIALHNILEEIKHTGYMDAFTTVQKLRQDRINMVQTAEQYAFLHKAVQIAMVCKGTTVTTHNLRDRLQSLSGESSLEKEFKSVCMVCSEDDHNDNEEEPQENNTYCNSRLFTNRVKNRVENVLPKEYYRPVLRCENEQVGDYINAVLTPSCEKHDHHILTQLPLPITVIDLWRLVIQYKVSLIVAFERDLSSVDKTIGEYLPDSEGETKTCSFLNIKTTPMDSSDTWNMHRIVVSVNEEHASKMANMPFKGEYSLKHMSWNNKDLSFKNLLILTENIRSMKPVGEGRILFMCRNGAELSGLACTMSLLLDRIDNDQHVSVPLVVGTLKAIRPQVIPTLDQYSLLYQTLNLFNETNNEYSNFNAT